MNHGTESSFLFTDFELYDANLNLLVDSSGNVSTWVLFKFLGKLQPRSSLKQYGDQFISEKNNKKKHIYIYTARADLLGK